MIAVRIRGGLGNQMFQYATGRALALRLGCELALDLRDWAKARQFDFALEHFNIQTVPARNLPLGRGDSVAEIIRKVFSGRKMKTLREQVLGYNNAIETVSAGTVLKGYWQTERYFSDAVSQIRKDFTFTTAPDELTARIAAELSRAPAISLHVRRGDYVSQAHVNQAHGTADLSYYARAAEKIAAAMKDEPIIYAFSDDPGWVRDNLSLPFEMRFVSHNTAATAHNDMRLMSLCQHHIIANSSFSWWGAWLNPSAEKIVCAPKRWFASETMHNPDITPRSWVRM